MDTPQATARIAGHPLHPLLVTIPIGCWVLALLTDIAYWRGGWAMWEPMQTALTSPRRRLEMNPRESSAPNSVPRTAAANLDAQAQAYQRQYHLRVEP